MANMLSPLRPFVWRIRLETLLKSLVTSLVTAVSAALITLLVMFFVGMEYNWLIILIAVASTFVVTFLLSYFLIFRISKKEIIRRVDDAGLQNSVSTMLELKDDTSYIAKLQREDTLKRIKEAKPKVMSIRISLVAGIILLSVSLTTAAAALVPPRELPVIVDFDLGVPEGEKADPLIGQLGDDIRKNESFTKYYDKLPDILKDELQDILDQIENLTGSTMDKITELEKLKDYLNELLKQNSYGTLLSDYMKQFESLRALGTAIANYDNNKIHAALYAMCWTYPTQVSKIITKVNSAYISENVRKHLLGLLAPLKTGLIGLGDTNSFKSDNEAIQAVIDAIVAEYPKILVPDGSVEICLSQQTEFAKLGQALLASNPEQVKAEFDVLMKSCIETVLKKETIDGREETKYIDQVNMKRIEELEYQLEAALDATSDSRDSKDPMWNAVYDFRIALMQVPDSKNQPVESMKRLYKIFGDPLGEVGTAEFDFLKALTTKENDTAYYEETITALKDIRNGYAYARYLYNKPDEDWYDGDGNATGVVFDLIAAIDEGSRGGLQYYEESALVNALHDLRDWLGAKKAVSVLLTVTDQYPYNNYIEELIGVLDPNKSDVDIHLSNLEKYNDKNWKDPLPTLANICIRICLALEPEEALDKVVGDMKDEIQDSIDDLLGKEETDDEELDTGIDVKPPQNEDMNGPPSDSENSESSENNKDENQNRPGGGGQQDTENDFSGLTYYNPETGQMEELTREKLDEIKADIDDAIAKGNYTPEQQTQMYNYYNYLLEKFEKSEE